ILPEQTLQLLHDHVLHPSSTLRTISSYALLGMQQVTFLLQPLVERGMRALHNSPDFVFLGLLLALFFIVLRILLWVQQMISFFARLAFRAVLWMLIGLAVMAVWNRGPEAFITDMAVLGRRLVLYAALVKEIWIREYQKYDAQTRAGAGAGSFSGGTINSGRSAGYSGRW
ncbi:hypothetical protein E0Z10_g10781, partial [Xylaria hypoxylon]